MALTAKEYPTDVHRNIGDAFKGKETTFKAKANTKYANGDFVVISATGVAEINATPDVIIDGIVTANIDNSTGADGDINVPVLVRGNVWVDTVLNDTTALDIKIKTPCGVYTGGQAVANAGANKQFTSLFIQNAPGSGSITKKGLFYFKGSGFFG